MFFFFKQKTAYEMRISDWSSDVCSSDLQVRAGFQVIGMDLRDHVRARQRQQVVVALQVVALARAVAGRLPAVETFGAAFAAVVGILEAVALDHTAHRAADTEEALGERAFLGGAEVGWGHGRGVSGGT